MYIEMDMYVDSITDARADAEALYDGGWRAEDREQLMEAFNLTDDEVDDICIELEDIESDHVM